MPPNSPNDEPRVDSLKKTIKPKPFLVNLLNDETINKNETTWMQSTTQKRPKRFMTLY